MSWKQSPKTRRIGMAAIPKITNLMFYDTSLTASNHIFFNCFYEFYYKIFILILTRVRYLTLYDFTYFASVYGEHRNHVGLMGSVTDITHMHYYGWRHMDSFTQHGIALKCMKWMVPCYQDSYLKVPVN